MVEVTIAMVRTYHSLAGVKDEEVISHLASANRDYKNVKFACIEDKEEAISCKTIYYIAPILWAKGMKNFPEYETIYSTYGDVDKFQNFWKKRAEAAVERASGSPATGKITYAGV
ncbi:MAG: hypothetical protein ACK5LP_07700 [Campylobacteraceae bacterium]